MEMASWWKVVSLFIIVVVSAFFRVALFCLRPKIDCPPTIYCGVGDSSIVRIHYACRRVLYLAKSLESGHERTGGTTGELRPEFSAMGGSESTIFSTYGRIFCDERSYLTRPTAA